MPETEVFRNYGFFLELQGQRVGFFTKISGLGLAVEVIEHREGGMPATVHKLPGRTKVNDVELSWGVNVDGRFATMIKDISEGRIQRFNCSVVVLAPDGKTELTRWNLGNAWLRQFELADFDALGNDVLIERLTLTADTLERASGGTAAAPAPAPAPAA